MFSFGTDSEFLVVDKTNNQLVNPYVSGGGNNILGADGNHITAELRTRPTKKPQYQILEVGRIIPLMYDKRVHIATPNSFNRPLGSHVHTELRGGTFYQEVLRLINLSYKRLAHQWGKWGYEDEVVSRSGYGQPNNWRTQNWKPVTTFPRQRKFRAESEEKEVCRCKICATFFSDTIGNGEEHGRPTQTLAAELRMWPTALADPALMLYTMLMTGGAIRMCEENRSPRSKYEELMKEWDYLLGLPTKNQFDKDWRDQWKIRLMGFWDYDTIEEIGPKELIELNKGLTKPVHIVDCDRCAIVARDMGLGNIVQYGGNKSCTKKPRKKYDLAKLASPQDWVKVKKEIWRIL